MTIKVTKYIIEPNTGEYRGRQQDPDSETGWSIPDPDDLADARKARRAPRRIDCPAPRRLHADAAEAEGIEGGTIVREYKADGPVTLEISAREAEEIAGLLVGAMHLAMVGTSPNLTAVFKYLRILERMGVDVDPETYL